MESNQVQKQPSKGKFWRNLWLISILVFLVSLLLFIFGFIGGDGTKLPVLSSLASVTLMLSIPAGILSFLVWIFKSGNRVVKLLMKIGIGSLGVLVSIWFLLFIYPSKSVWVDGASMEPTFKDGERFFVNRLGSPKRGEVVDYMKDGGEYIGRIVGLPGETVYIKPGEVKVNDSLINEPYVDWSNWAENREQQIPLKDDEFLVLLDKRSGSNPIIKKIDIIGVFYFKYWPLKDSGFIKY